MMQNLKEISTEELIVKWEEWYNTPSEEDAEFYINGHRFEDVYWELTDRGISVSV